MTVTYSARITQKDTGIYEGVFVNFYPEKDNTDLQLLFNGNTYEECLADGKKTLISAIDEKLANNEDLPEPYEFENTVGITVDLEKD